MQTILTADAAEMGRWVAEHAATDLARAIDQQGHARLLVATGASQFEIYKQLVEHPGVDWAKVDGFHLDEYEGISADHKASFCKYLRERFVDLVPLASFHYLHGHRPIAETIERANRAIRTAPIDVALVGIGENGHLAFNDPPADFKTEEPYLVVQLDEACRRQQVGEGWFDSLDDVPRRAISMSIRQIMNASRIYCSVPDQRKAEAVRKSLEGPITPDVPASILRDHPNCVLVIDEAAASELGPETRNHLERP